MHHQVCLIIFAVGVWSLVFGFFSNNKLDGIFWRRDCRDDSMRSFIADIEGTYMTLMFVRFSKVRW